MTVIGIGIDMQKIDRIRSLFEDGGGSRVFTERELEYCLGKVDPYIHMAGRFSAKEAVIKALRMDGKTGLVMDQIEITNDHDGSPVCNLHGHVKDQLDMMGGSSVLISISHTDSDAVAFAICIG